MAQKRISELPVLTAEPDGTSIIPLVQDGATMSVTFDALKQKMVRQVEADVDSTVDNKLTSKTNYAVTTMVDLGFTPNSYIKVRDFWKKLHDRYGTHGVIQFFWNYGASASIGDANANNIQLSGGTLIYTCGSAPSIWRAFSAIYFNGWERKAYHIYCSVGADDAEGSETWGIEALAYDTDVRAINSTLLNLNQKFDDTYKYYPNTTKIIGKWVDGANIIRAVIPASAISVGSDSRAITVSGDWTSTSKIKAPLKALVALSNNVVEASLVKQSSSYNVVADTVITPSNIEYVIVEYIGN